MEIFKIVIGVGALFNTTDSKKAYAEGGLAGFNKYMRKKESIPLKQGAAFGFVQKMLNLNKLSDQYKIKVIVVSRFSPTASMRVMNSIKHYGLDIAQAHFCQSDRLKYIKVIDPHLFLSTHPEDVGQALALGIPGAVLTPRDYTGSLDDQEVRIAIDGDSCLFSNEADLKYHEGGLAAFREYELENSKKTLGAGPLKPFVEGISKIQASFEEGKCPIKLALITARGAPAHERPLRTLRKWGVEIDEAMFCDGDSKGKFAEAFGAEILFDDSRGNCQSAESHGVASGHVPFGTGGIVLAA